jgi:hypothetical protein
MLFGMLWADKFAISSHQTPASKPRRSKIGSALCNVALRLSARRPQLRQASTEVPNQDAAVRIASIAFDAQNICQRQGYFRARNNVPRSDLVDLDSRWHEILVINTFMPVESVSAPR